MQYNYYPIGDDAFTIQFGEYMNVELNAWLHVLRSSILAKAICGIEDVIVAYHSLSVYYNPLFVVPNNNQETKQEYLLQQITSIIKALPAQKAAQSISIKKIPVCFYESVAMDLLQFCSQKKISHQTFIEIFCSQTYQVFMTGFLPGFPYMGILPKELYGQRKKQPVTVLAGSVGIAGLQTGIYPVQSPGGWQIVGATPMEIFKADAPHPCYLHPGDKVQYYPITIHEYNNIKSRHSR